MQFIKGGPDVPERLIQAHEQGSVVFFCGAGISYPAGLPGFDGLVKKLFESLGTEPNSVQRTAIKAGQLDTAVGLLEADIVGGRETVRRELSDILVPNFSPKNATSTHESLLTLANTRDGQFRLITTNFDRIFEKVINQNNLSIERFDAPLLPVPKNKWNGLVYLHGLLSNSPSPANLDRLVISSGDFGLAYLTERWAARFVSELFRNFTVCFVGYSINDPVLRYMMDALAADKLLGESPPEMFSFGSYTKGKENSISNEWRAKNVTPILYREHSRHYYLHQTLKTWAETYRDGIRGKEKIAAELGMVRPGASTEQDNYVTRLLWALSEPNGLPAKRFAELNPVPSLEWLNVFSSPRYKAIDLPRFGVSPIINNDEKLTFSLVCRPAPYTLAPRMELVNRGNSGSYWDKILPHIARWLTRHLDDPNLLIWVVKGGGQLHESFTREIENKLDEFSKLAREGNSTELDKIKSKSPRAIPSPIMEVLWRVVLTGRVQSSKRSFHLYQWRDRLKRYGLTPTLRLELRELLTPNVVLKEPLHWGVDETDVGHSENIRRVVDWEIVLSTEHVSSGLENLRRDDSWQSAQPELISDFTQLLTDVLDLKRELGGANEKSDLSYIGQASITEHSQNRKSRNWTALIELTRDSWLLLAKDSPEKAYIEAKRWKYTSYPLFRRLAFFAAAHENVVSPAEALEWLLDDNHWWLWSVETHRETMRLIVSIVIKLSVPELWRLEKAIISGPPRAMFKEDLEEGRWSSIVEREVWLRFAKLKDSGVVLTVDSTTRLNELVRKHPNWKLSKEQRDEFPIWHGAGDSWRKYITTPKDPVELALWLKERTNEDTWQEDDWRDRCNNDFSRTAYALCILAKQDCWPVERWREALQAWSRKPIARQSWRFMAPIVFEAPDEIVKELVHGISWWVQSAAKVFTSHDELFLNLVKRLLALVFLEDSEFDDPVQESISHPIGLVTQALLDYWYRRTPLADNTGLPDELTEVFTLLCDKNCSKFIFGRTILASKVITLYRVAPEWTSEYLLPLFDWQKDETEARAAWEGFLWSPRLYWPLLEEIRQPFLDTASRFNLIGNHGEQYVYLLTNAALGAGSIFTKTELANAIRLLPADGLQYVADSLVNSLEGSAEQADYFWKHRISPFIKSIWPKAKTNLTEQISENLTNLCIAADSNFPEAVYLLGSWIKPHEYPDYAVHQLHDSGICKLYPNESLDFLSLIIGVEPRGYAGELSKCLTQIISAKPELERNHKYKRLSVY